MSSQPHNPSLFSIVEVIDPNSEVVKSYLINYSHHDTKVWLTRTLVWCLNNDHMLTIESASHEEVMTKPLFIPKTDVEAI